MNEKKDLNKLTELSSCPKCGKEFFCSTSSKCWCFEHDVPAEAMDLLQEGFEGCLCPECLVEYTR